MRCDTSPWALLTVLLSFMNTCLQDLVQHWITKYDWRAEEARLNSSLHHFKMPVNSIDLHFVHERSPNEHAVPLILIHGWPGSILEFTELIPKLVNPGECLCESNESELHSKSVCSCPSKIK